MALIIALAWALLALPVALVIGRSLRIADRRALARPVSPVPDFFPAELLNDLDQRSPAS